MKVIAAMDSFKGCCSAESAGAAVCKGALRADAAIEAVNIPVSDGGEGMIDALIYSGRGRWVPCEVTGPMGEAVAAGYALLEDRTAVVEMSLASGLTLVPANSRNPGIATTYGTGQLIRAALDAGCRNFLVGIGGSATNDGGAGMMQALGVHFLDQDGRELPFGGAALRRLEQVDISGMDPRLTQCRILVASDVRNPLCGPNGASHVYGPQKGATPAMVEELDAALTRYARVLASQLGRDVAGEPGAGAAGGLGAALYAFMNAEFCAGIEAVLDLLNFSDQIADADMVFTGEGCTDAQTLFGKVPAGVAKAVKQKADIPVYILSGGIRGGAEALYGHGIDGIFSIADGPITLEESQRRAEELLERGAEAIVRAAMAARRAASDPKR